MVHITENNKEAEEWDIQQLIGMTPSEQQKSHLK